MANPLQPKCIKVLELEYDMKVTKLVSGSKAGDGDCIACRPPEGLYYMFEFKWKTDRPSRIQKEKINQVIDAGGRAYFIRSVDELRGVLDNNTPPTYYASENKLSL